ncbi:MAG: cytidylate kinase-like family protein [Eubacteriales bacterium]|nr:cytidylate kinase-like family protein [Eubacteriales bacterium]
MSGKIITISREFGSGGRFIGEEVAKKLGFSYYDKNIIHKIAEKSGMSVDFIEENAELSPRKGLFSYAFIGRDKTGKSVEDIVYEAQRKVILEIAEKGDCVIVGRNANYILREFPNTINVFIHGNMPEKVKRICKIHNLNEKQAEIMIHDIDKRRKTNYQFYTDQKWGAASNYTLSLNSSQLGYEKCMELIMNCLK